MLQRLLLSKHWSHQLLRYVAIGGSVFLIDVGLFQLLVSRSLALPIATTLAFAAAVTTHFTLNKFANFRAHDRPVHAQALTYSAVAIVSWLVTVGVVQVGVERFAMVPLGAKLVAVALNLPIGFLGHRFLTFGPGILVRVRQMFDIQARL